MKQFTYTLYLHLKLRYTFLIFKHLFQCIFKISLLPLVPDITKLCVKQTNTLYEDL